MGDRAKSLLRASAQIGLSPADINRARLVLRMREVVALQEVDAEVAAPFVFFDGFETFGERLRADFAAEVDEHFHEVLFDRFVGER